MLKGGGDPKITRRAVAGVHGDAARQAGSTRIDGDLVLDRTFFAPAAHDPAAFDGEPLKPYNVGPDALLVNFKSVRFGFAPDAADDARWRRSSRRLRAVAVGAAAAALGGPLRRLARRARARRFVDQGTRAEATFAGRYPAACGERDWWVSLLDHPDVRARHVRHVLLAPQADASPAAGGTASRRAARTPFATLESPPLWDVVRDVNKLSNNVMARQLFLTLATVDAPAAGDDRARHRNRAVAGSRGATSGCPELVLENGSGLSRRERISAGSLARLLLAADASAVREEFASSLAVAAMDGTRAAALPERHASRGRRCSRRARSKASARSRAT